MRLSARPHLHLEVITPGEQTVVPNGGSTSGTSQCEGLVPSMRMPIRLANQRGARPR